MSKEIEVIQTAHGLRITCEWAKEFPDAVESLIWEANARGLIIVAITFEFDSRMEVWHLTLWGNR